MSQTSHLLTALKKILRAKGLTYRDVAGALDLSEASVKRIFAEQSFSLKRLEEICRYLDMTIYELSKLASVGDQEPVSVLSLEQETALARDRRLLAYFYLLLNGWSPAELATKFDLSEIQSTRMLATLDKLKLIELYPRNRARLLTARTIAWRKGGPVRRLYEQQVKAEFLETDFGSDGALLKFETAEVSESTAKIVLRKIDKLIREFDDLVELDMAAPHEQKRSVGLLIAYRPWVFSLFTDQKQWSAR